ncbi:hypothetical protein N0V86_006528 [Didymella sp. IMI 355093]|nr:hypothetical protein N0V86_006528 [Didymella sp. IMI 355093]
MVFSSAAVPSPELLEPAREGHDQPLNKARFEAACKREFEEATESDEGGLIFEPSSLRRPGELTMVNNDEWQTVEIWYALPPFDFRKVGRKLQAERTRLSSEVTLQDRAFLPKIDSNREYTTLEKLIAQRKILETKLQILKYRTAKLVNPAKPSMLLTEPSGDAHVLLLKEQRLRSINRRLALEVNWILKHTKHQHNSLSNYRERRYLPLKGSFGPLAPSNTVSHRRNRNSRQPARMDTKGKGKTRSHRTRAPSRLRDSLDWPAPEDVVGYDTDSDATDEEDWDSPSFREVSAAAWKWRRTSHRVSSESSDESSELFSESSPEPWELLSETSKQ